MSIILGHDCTTQNLPMHAMQLVLCPCASYYVIIYVKKIRSSLMDVLVEAAVLSFKGDSLPQIWHFLHSSCRRSQ